MTEEEETLRSRMNTASTNLRNSAAYKQGQGKENAYAQAYRALMLAGLAYPLKRKYLG
jgi:hypothetical protein